MNRFKKYSFFLSTAAVFIFYGFVADKDCLAEVKKVFHQMTPSLDDGKVYYLKYTMVSTFKANERDKENTINTSTVELITSKKQNRMYAKDAIVLKDENDVFTILPAKKIIYWSNNALDKKKDENTYEKLRNAQDSLFKYSEKVTCIKVKNQQYNTIANVYLSERMAQALEIKKAAYSYNDQTYALSRVMIEYLPNKKLQHLVYDFNQIDNNYKKADMQIPVRQLVFVAANKLQSDYADFKVIDIRKK